jgi:flavoprotein
LKSGVARVNLLMFLRKLKNRSGSMSIQIISKTGGKYKVVKTIGTGSAEHISFIAYCIYKELERVLHNEKTTITLKKAAELTQNMYQITYTLPESKHTKNLLLKMDDQQAELYRIIGKNF